MLAPRSAKALHVLIPENSHGMRNRPGSPSFFGNCLVLLGRVPEPEVESGIGSDKFGKHVHVIGLGNLPSIHLEFEELELDRRELDKQEVEQPEVDRFDLDKPGVETSEEIPGWKLLEITLATTGLLQ
ncbi:hypothetical protein Tco_0016338 [Tanacetum coccineum]